jgi:hypothetical protein
MLALKREKLHDLLSSRSVRHLSEYLGTNVP